MLNRFQIFGKKGEAMAAKHLKKMGYTILEKNHKNRMGEIDIIAKDKQVLVFVEVKSRSSSSYGTPEAAIHPEKIQKLTRAALFYLKAHQITGSPARFDVVSVYLENKKEKPVIKVIQNAFSPYCK